MPRLLLPLFLLPTIFLGGCQSDSLEKPSPSDTTPQTAFHNPILAGFNPDPSICRVGEDYYLVNSSFGYFPGIPVLHSRDLVNWQQIGAAITRTEQMDMTKQGLSRGLFAPAISYHEGWFYIVCTLIDNGGNFIVKSQNPEGPYSNPYWLPELNGGIDPSLFFDDDGRVYVVYNQGAPDNNPLYDGHRTLRLHELDPTTLQVKGEEHLLVNGGTDLAKEPIWIEGPHIYKLNGYYYLMAAEGGTSYNHSEVIFRSESLNGPYESYAGNPILTQRDLDPTRPDPITSTGHADLIQTPDGDWWAVFLGCRPYEGEYYNTGRETFLAPVRWEDGWPIINPDHEEVQQTYPLPLPEVTDTPALQLGGLVNYRVDFDEPLDQRWLFLRNVKEPWYTLNRSVGKVRVALRPETIADQGNPSLMLRRQPHPIGEVSTYLEFEPQSDNEQAGLVVLQNADHYYFINKAQNRLQLLKKSADGYEVLAEKGYQEQGVHLQIKAIGNKYHFYYKADDQEWQTLAYNVDATYLSTATAGGFVGCMYGLYASSQGQPSETEALFSYFEVKSSK